MYLVFEDRNPDGGYLYRSASEMTAEIEGLKERIENCRKNVNVREMIVQSLLGDEGEAENRARMLHNLVALAGESVTLMRDLEERLDVLWKEWEETRWIMV